MARRSITGQLNMFELFNSLDNNSTGEVEMVSLMPSFEEETELEETSEGEEISENEEIFEDEEISENEEIFGDEEISENEEIFENEEISEIEKPVMSRTYEVQGEKIEVAYLNYNKVRISRSGVEPEIRVFASSKEAVDYYVLLMQEWEKDEE